MQRAAWGWIFVWLVTFPALAAGQDEPSGDLMYERGVQAYFAGRYGEAETMLSSALAGRPNDPRPYYFRGLTRLRLGRTAEACRDMQAGAYLESQALTRHAVGSALQRVQGPDRLALERFRRYARENAATARAQLSRERHQQITVRDHDVLREQVVIPLDELLRAEGPRALTAQELARRAEVAAGMSVDRRGAERASRPAAAPEDPFREDSPAPAAGPAAPPLQPAPRPSAPAEADSEPEDDPGDDPFADFGT